MFMNQCACVLCHNSESRMKLHSNRHPLEGGELWIWQLTHGSPIKAFGDDGISKFELRTINIYHL